MTKMTESELKSILAAEIADSLAHLGGELADQRRKALRYYLGEPFGNELEGRSKVVSTDVSDTIEWILPSLLKIFTAGDDVVRFEPTGPEDEEVAKQATEYVNWIFNRDNAGFFSLSGAQELRDIGHQRVDRFFWNDVNQTYLNRISAAIDPINKLYVVSYPGPGSEFTAGTPNRLLIYNWSADRWSRAEVEMEMIHQAASQAGYTLDSLDSFSTSLDALPFSLDSRVWTGSGRLLLAGFTTQHTIGFFNGANMAATVDTGEAQLVPGRRALVRSRRPLVDGGGAAGASVRVGTRNRTVDPVSFDAAVPLNALGVCPARASGRYLRARIEMSAGVGWGQIQGIDEIDAAPLARDEHGVSRPARWRRRRPPGRSCRQPPRPRKDELRGCGHTRSERGEHDRRGSRATGTSVILLTARTANAAAEIGNGALYVSALSKGGFTIAHANNPLADRTFDYVVIG